MFEPHSKGCFTFFRSTKCFLQKQSGYHGCLWSWELAGDGSTSIHQQHFGRNVRKWSRLRHPNIISCKLHRILHIHMLRPWRGHQVIDWILTWRWHYLNFLKKKNMGSISTWNLHLHHLIIVNYSNMYDEILLTQSGDWARRREDVR